MEPNAKNPPDSDFFSPPELARKLNMSLKWVVKHTQARRIAGQVKIGRLWRYNKIEVEKRLISGQEFLLKK